MALPITSDYQTIGCSVPELEAFGRGIACFDFAYMEERMFADKKRECGSFQRRCLNLARLSISAVYADV